jgi:hypothetical protein
MYKRITAVAMVAAFAAMTGSADVLASYDYTDVAGADPVAQGWSLTGGNGQWNSAHDSGSAWQINDGTTAATTYYEQAVNSALMAASWTMTADMSFLSTLIGQDSTVLADWHRANNNNNGHSLWLENTAAGYHYWVRFVVDGEDLYATDGTTTHQLTTDGSGFDVTKSISMEYDGTDATLSVGGSDYAIASFGAGLGSDRVIFGMPSGSNYGSADYTSVTFDAIPEPATFGMVVLFGGAILFIRRKMMI